MSFVRHVGTILGAAFIAAVLPFCLWSLCYPAYALLGWTLDPSEGWVAAVVRYYPIGVAVLIALTRTHAAYRLVTGNYDDSPGAFAGMSKGKYLIRRTIAHVALAESTGIVVHLLLAATVVLLQRSGPFNDLTGWIFLATYVVPLFAEGFAHGALTRSLWLRTVDVPDFLREFVGEVERTQS